MLPLLIGLLVFAGPLLRGSWDLWAQSLLFLAVGAGFGLWLAFRLLVGYLPLPSRRNLLWTGALAGLSGLSASLSPISSYSIPAWRSLLLGLWLFPAIAAVSKDERAGIDEAVRACAWILILLAFYQRFHQHMGIPPATFLNTNVFAGTALLLLPLAVQKKDWILASALVLILIWSRSLGAWLGLSGALLLTRRQAGAAAYWLGAGIGLVCLVALYAKLLSPDVLHRWHWWAAAVRMAWTRPWLGLGPGAFAYALPAYQHSGSELGSLYAHQYFLETAAECGIPYVLVWGAGLLHCLRRGGAHKRFGALAILIHSLWDYPLSIPANFWLFCYFAASSNSESARGANVPARLKIPCAALVLAASFAACRTAWDRWEADRLKAWSAERFTEGGKPSEILPLLERSLALARDPEAERLAAEAELRRLGEGPSGRILGAAAEHLERAAALNPYRASTWAALERLYRQLGDPETARRKRREGSLYCPVLREGAL